MVKVVTVHAPASVMAGATVDAQPIVSMVDGAGNATAHGAVPGIQCARGIAPSAGDIGLIVVCDRDISSAKANGGAIGPPNTGRIFDLADGVYVCTLFSAAESFVIADGNGNTITMGATGIVIADSNTPQNLIQMKAGGIINITNQTNTAILQVNGVPVTVP
jgi:hypothetical protein